MTAQWGYAVTALAGVIVGYGIASAYLRGPLYLTPTATDTTPPTAAEIGGMTITAYVVEETHGATDAVWEVVTVPDGDFVISTADPRMMSPDCRQEKHRACTGVGFDPVADDVTDCPCTCHTPREDPRDA